MAVTGLLSGLSAYHWRQTSSESVRINNLVYLTEQVRSELFRQIHEVIRARVLEERRALQLYAEYSRRIDTHFNQLRQNAATRQESAAIQGLQQSYREIQRDMNQIFSDPYAADHVARVKILDPRFADYMVGHFEERYGFIKRLLENELVELDETMQRWAMLGPVLGPIVFLLAVALVILTRQILRTGFVEPMATVKEGARQVSRGNLHHRIPLRGVNEVNEIAESINHMAAELERNRDALVESERQAALGALVPVVAHNIRNPLASIRATAQLLDAGDAPGEFRESQGLILDTIDRLNRWVNALVSYLHPLRPNFRPTTVTALIEASLKVLQAKLRDKDIEVEKRNWDLDRQLSADPDLMEQALTGLIANAIDASPDGGRIRLELRRDGGRLALHIRDSGPGLPFRPEAGNLEPGPSTKRYGTGLGIPIAFKICQSHGWDLSFNNPPEGGSEVIILAALQREAEAA